MMKRELGGKFFGYRWIWAFWMLNPHSPGVVDSDLKVYDTANVRVVDASVLALQVSAHLSSTLYGIAEKAADIIKAAQ